MVRMKMGLASREDDYAIRECLRNNEMPGQISIAFETEPSYFDALSVQGSESQVMVGRSDEGEIMGFGTRSFKSAYVNGKVIDIGYLGGLRVRPEFRNGIGLVKAYRYLRELNDDGRVPFYLTTIIEDNFEARHFLESGKMGLPNYHQLDVLSTFMIKPRKKEPEGLIEIVGGDSFDIEEILEFVNDEGSNKQFSPHYDISDFKGDRFRGLSQSDFYVAVDGGEIMGTLARWDQESFKQTRIVGYDAKLSFARPFINAISRFSNIPNLPPVGNIINYSYLAFPTVKGNDPVVLKELLSSVLSDPEHSGYDYFSIGLTESDPLSTAVKPFSPREYRAILYVVAYDKKLSELNFDPYRVHYLELATL